MGFPLICEIIPDESADNIQICLHFQVSYISQAVAENIARDFVALVGHITQYPSAQASDKRLLGIDIPRVFEQKVSSTPNPVQFLTKFRQKRPWSYQEEIVRDILCKFSDVDWNNVFQDTTIFQLGLDSINAVQVSAKLRGLGYKISSGDILEVCHTGVCLLIMNSILFLLTYTRLLLLIKLLLFLLPAQRLLRKSSLTLGFSKPTICNLFANNLGFHRK